MTWRDDAACREIGTELFFVEGDGPGSVLLRRQAKEFCGSCPVLMECRDWALSQDITTIREGGILGGMSPRELVREKTRREGTPARPRPVRVQQGAVCVSCGEPMSPQHTTPTPGTVPHHGHGACNACYQRARARARSVPVETATAELAVADQSTRAFVAALDALDAARPRRTGRPMGRDCTGCGRPLATGGANPPPGHARHDHDGRCRACADKARRDAAGDGPPLRCTRCADPMRTQDAPIPGRRTVRASHDHDGWCVRCATTGDLRDPDRRPA